MFYLFSFSHKFVVHVIEERIYSLLIELASVLPVSTPSYLSIINYFIYCLVCSEMLSHIGSSKFIVGSYKPKYGLIPLINILKKIPTTFLGHFNFKLILILLWTHFKSYNLYGAICLHQYVPISNIKLYKVFNLLLFTIFRYT